MKVLFVIVMGILPSMLAYALGVSCYELFCFDALLIATMLCGSEIYHRQATTSVILVSGIVVLSALFLYFAYTRDTDTTPIRCWITIGASIGSGILLCVTRFTVWFFAWLLTPLPSIWEGRV